MIYLSGFLASILALSDVHKPANTFGSLRLCQVSQLPNLDTAAADKFV